MRRSSTLLLAFALSACQGLIGDDPDPGTDPEASPEGACQVDGALSVPMQRINLAQFQQVATELFGSGLTFSGSYPAPLQGSPFSTYAAANPLADAEVAEVMEATEAVAMQVVDRLPACSGDERACASDYLTDLMGRAFRRPVKPEELSIALDLYDTARADMDHAESLGVAVFGVLQMPQFLYVLEDLPAAGERKDLDGLEIAQRLALVLWDGLPDDELLAAAAEGKLANAEERRAQATRMLGDARAARTVSNFLREWLKVKDFRASVHEPELQDALEEELRRDLADALAAPDGLSELFTSSHTHVNSVLEGFYGLPTTSTGPDDWHEVDLPAEQRVGILTHPLLMARFAHGDAPSSILRGQFVRVNLLCGNIPPPPAGAADVQAELTPSGATPREQAQARLDHPTCGSCHQQMDPIGFGFEAFDGAGRYLPTIDGQPVDDAGQINAPSTLEGSFSGVRELGEKLAASEEARACFARQWLRYSLGKEETDKDERCTMATVSASMLEGGQSQTLMGILASGPATAAFVARFQEEN